MLRCSRPSEPLVRDISPGSPSICKASKVSRSKAFHWMKSKISCTSLTEGYISYTPHSISCTFSVADTWCVGNNFLYCMGSPCILHCLRYLSARLSCAEWVDHVSCTVSGTYRLVCPVLNGFTMYPALFLIHAGEIEPGRSSLAEHSKVSSSMSCSQTEGFSDSG